MRWNVTRQKCSCIMDELMLADQTDASHAPEMGLIGAVLRDQSQFSALKDILTPSDFHWHSYGWIWKAFERLHEQGLRIDVITVGDELQRNSQLDDFVLDGAHVVKFSGRAALAHIRTEGEPSSAESYARQVKDYSAKRQQEEIFTKGVYWAKNGRSADDIKNDIALKLESVQTWNGQVSKHTQTIGEAITDAHNRTYEASKGEVSSVETGLIDLDKLLAPGMYAPGLYILGGRPGQGKSAFLATVAKNAGEAGKRIAIFSLEMANRQIAQRLIAMESGIPTDRQRTGKLFEDEWPKFTYAIEKLSALPITLNDMPAISPNRMRQVLRRLPGVDLVLVDYVQLSRPDEKKANRYQEVDAVSQGLKAIAKEFDVPVLAAAQLSRAAEQRKSQRPILSDLRESGGLEQDSDVILFIHKPDEYEDKSKQNVTELIVAKHRDGPVGSVELIYRPTLTKFENAQTKHVVFNEAKY